MVWAAWAAWACNCPFRLPELESGAMTTTPRKVSALRGVLPIAYVFWLSELLMSLNEVQFKINSTRMNGCATQPNSPKAFERFAAIAGQFLFRLGQSSAP